MSLKNAEQKPPAGSRRRWSITSRLIVIYTLSAIAMLAITAVYHNWSLHSSLLKAERDYINDRIRVYRAVIEHSPDFLFFILQDIEWQGSFVTYPQYNARLLNDKCHIIIETAHMNTLIPPDRFPDACVDNKEPQERPRSDKNIVYRGKNGRSYLLGTYWTQTVYPPQRIAIQIAIDITAQEGIIQANQRQMIAIIMFGIAFAVLFSVVVARRVLSPLDELAETAKQINMDKLSMRATDPHRWPVELQSLAVAFNDMLGRLEDSFTRLFHSASNLAHALRTPINNLMGEAEVALSQERTNDEYRKVLESSLEEHMRLSRLIEAIFFLSRAENHATVLELTQFNPKEEIEKVFSFYEALAADKKARLSCQGNGLLTGDRIFIRRAISNLVSNALYYSAHGVKIDITIRQAEDNDLEIIVSDTGYGIAEKDLRHIFNRFYRVETSNVCNPQGSGLGLSIVKSIMDIHNGTVTIQSAPGQGTTITLRFPGETGQRKNHDHVAHHGNDV
jgi:two-component system heavy metal sensor histidine kinase CusS